MAFLRFARDKRGYEQFYLVEPSSRRGRPQSRILYWYRTPPNLKVGREPFDPETRRVLEAQNPDVAFNWERLLETPVPPPVEPERWRERRDAERRAKLAMRAEARAATATEASRSEPADLEEIPPVELIVEPSAVPPASTEPQPCAAVAAPEAVRRRRRRRRGRRGRPMTDGGVPTSDAQPPEAVEAAEGDVPGSDGDHEGPE